MTPTSPSPTPAVSSIAGLPIKNTKNLINPETKLCMLLYAHAKRGKTRFGKTIDDFTKKYCGRPTLFIAMEPSEGGGTMSLQEYDVDYVVPGTIQEFNQIIAALASDTKYAGIVVDSLTEYVNRFLKPYALKFPYLKGTPSATRAAGVPEQGDYQTMGEQCRIDLNKLINLTVNPDPRIRKHLLVTALEREKMSRDGKEIVSINPDLPGAMSAVATSMFQTVGCIELKTEVVPDPKDAKKTTRVTRYQLLTGSTEENKRVIGDRTGLIPTGSPLDFVQIYEQYWLPKLNRA